jgi:hypothetical protein
MSVSTFLDSALPDPQRRERLYRGDIFVFSPSPASRDLIALASDMLAHAFAPHDPRTVHEHSTPEAVAAVLAKLKPQFIHHPQCKQTIPRLLAEHGVDLETTYFDVPRLRSAYPSDFLTAGIAYAFHPHRDTWYSAPMCQLNWWLPVLGLEPDNAMAFHPRYFAEAVENDSATYNYYAWNEQSRATAALHVTSDTRPQPRPQQEIEDIPLRLLPPPGGVIVFSGAQLHETVRNTSGIARYSIDFRTVHYDDVVARRGARNVDARCTGTTMRDYLRAADLHHLPDDVVALYDDGTEVQRPVLYFGDRLAAEAPRRIPPLA